MLEARGIWDIWLRLKPEKLEYISLVDKIPEEHRAFEDVWEIDYYKGRIIYRTEFKLFCWDGEQMKVISSEEGYHVGNIVNDTYYFESGMLGFADSEMTIPLNWFRGEKNLKVNVFTPFFPMMTRY